MKISGFTIVKNALKLHYPAVESIRSILPICDEFIVNVGDSEDGTLALIKSIGSPKIKIIQTAWDTSQGPTVLSQQTNIALKHCSGDWAFYLQGDEVIHEADLNKLKFWMRYYLDQKDVDALRFWWLHFYGSFWRYRIDLGWYQKQDRIIRNNGQVESCGDAFAFRRIDGKPLRTRRTFCYLYHYGWVNSNEAMQKRYENASQIGFANKNNVFAGEYGDLKRFPAYFGTHPAVMRNWIQEHVASKQDWQKIVSQYWWNPLLWFRVRSKTGRRVKERVI